MFYLQLEFLHLQCESQVIAQKNQTSSQVSPMNAEPVPNPEDTKGQLPPVNNEPLPNFSVPANPNGDIGEQVAAERALKIVIGKRFNASNSKVIKSSLMSYKEARQLGLEPLREDHPLINTQVRLVEISGTFQVRDRPSRQGVPTSTLTYTKGYIILRAADGLRLSVILLKE